MAKSNSSRFGRDDDDGDSDRSGPPSISRKGGGKKKARAIVVKKSDPVRQLAGVGVALAFLVACATMLFTYRPGEGRPSNERGRENVADRPVPVDTAEALERVRQAEEALRNPPASTSSFSVPPVAQAEKPLEAQTSPTQPKPEATEDVKTEVAATEETTPSEQDEATENVAPAEEMAAADEAPPVGPEDERKLDVARVIKEASNLMQGKKYKDAVATLNRASFKFKEDIRPDFYLGLVYSGVGANEPETAEKYFKRALERQPDHTALLNNLALVQIKNKKFRAAWTYFNKSMKDEKNPVADQNIGRLLNQSKILGIKKEDEKLIVGLNPNLNRFHQNEGWQYLPIDESPEAMDEYREFCRDGNLHDRSCSHCLGHGAVRCRICGGKRNIVITGTISNTFQFDRQSTITTNTPTSALVRCSGCGGDGRVDCSYCQDGTDSSLQANSSYGTVDSPRGNRPAR